MSLTIERGIPMPSTEKHAGRRPSDETLARKQMQVGDSYTVQGRDAVKVRNHLQVWVRYHGLAGWRFSVRTMEDGSLRVWRVA
jgi:hypothetical protein